MGTNAGPHVANIYLHVYEYDYIQGLIEIGDEIALKKLENIFRFQDDLLSINDFTLLGSIIDKIYPIEMVVNNTNISPRKCSYLDLLISIYRGKFMVALYDKRKSFSFNVINYPFLDGNIPTDRSYAVFTSQLIRFCKVNSCIKGFYKDVKDLVDKLCKQGFLLAALRNKFIKFYHNYVNCWAKYGIDIHNDFIKLFEP